MHSITVKLTQSEEMTDVPPVNVLEYKENKRYIHLKPKAQNSHSYLTFSCNTEQTGNLCALRSKYWPDTVVFFANPCSQDEISHTVTKM